MDSSSLEIKQPSLSKWKLNKNWSDRFLLQIKAIIGMCFVDEAPLLEDQKHNTDLVVLKLNSIRIACRVRKHPYCLNDNYKNQFTIRSFSNSHKTELHKIMDGWGDYIFYGFSDENEKWLHRWVIGNLNIFREFFGNSWQNAINFGDEIHNNDNTGGTAFNVSDFPSGFVKAHSSNYWI